MTERTRNNLNVRELTAVLRAVKRGQCSAKLAAELLHVAEVDVVQLLLRML